MSFQAILFFAGLMFTSLTVVYNRLESERFQAASKRYAELKYLVRVVAICNILALATVISSITGEFNLWLYAQDLTIILFFLTVLCTLYIIIMIFRSTFR